MPPPPTPQPTSAGVPPHLQPLPGLTTVASSDPVPGVTLDLQVPSTTLLAGSVMQTQVVIHNNSPTPIEVRVGAYALVDGQPETSGPADPREFPTRFARQAPGGPILPSGQTGALSSIVQVPFDAAASSHVHAYVVLHSVPSPGTPPPSDYTSVITEVPLQLIAPGPDQELHVELHADHQQWCVRATTASGDPTAEPLLVLLTVSGPRFGGQIGADTSDTNVWAGHWSFGYTVSNGVLVNPADGPLDVSAYVGSPNYVTASAQKLVPP